MQIGQVKQDLDVTKIVESAVLQLVNKPSDPPIPYMKLFQKDLPYNLNISQCKRISGLYCREKTIKSFVYDYQSYQRNQIFRQLMLKTNLIHFNQYQMIINDNTIEDGVYFIIRGKAQLVKKKTIKDSNLKQKLVQKMKLAAGNLNELGILVRRSRVNSSQHSNNSSSILNFNELSSPDQVIEQISSPVRDSMQSNSRVDSETKSYNFEKYSKQYYNFYGVEEGSCIGNMQVGVQDVILISTTRLVIGLLKKSDFEMIQQAHRHKIIKLISYLKKIFPRTENHILFKIVNNMQDTQLYKGNVLYKENEKIDSFYLIESGEIVLSKKKYQDDLMKKETQMVNVSLQLLSGGQFVGDQQLDLFGLRYLSAKVYSQRAFVYKLQFDLDLLMKLFMTEERFIEEFYQHREQKEQMVTQLYDYNYVFKQNLRLVDIKQQLSLKSMVDEIVDQKFTDRKRSLSSRQNADNIQIVLKKDFSTNEYQLHKGTKINSKDKSTHNFQHQFSNQQSPLNVKQSFQVIKKENGRSYQQGDYQRDRDNPFFTIPMPGYTFTKLMTQYHKKKGFDKDVTANYQYLKDFDEQISDNYFLNPSAYFKRDKQNYYFHYEFFKEDKGQNKGSQTTRSRATSLSRNSSLDKSRQIFDTQVIKTFLQEKQITVDVSQFNAISVQRLEKNSNSEKNLKSSHSVQDLGKIDNKLAVPVTPINIRKQRKNSLENMQNFYIRENYDIMAPQNQLKRPQTSTQNTKRDISSQSNQEQQNQSIVETTESNYFNISQKSYFKNGGKDEQN